MTIHRPRFATDHAGVAALEFAIIAPVLLMMFGGIVDFGRFLIGKGQLANGLAQAVGYALQQGPSVAPSVIAKMAKDASARSGVNASVTVSIIGPACYCISGQPAVLSATSTSTCTSTCPASSVSSSAYLIISTRYTFAPLMPFYDMLLPTQIMETATVRLQ